jgi:hypothetical protein
MPFAWAMRATSVTGMPMTPYILSRWFFSSDWTRTWNPSVRLAFSAVVAVGAVDIGAS